MGMCESQVENSSTMRLHAIERSHKYLADIHIQVKRGITQWRCESLAD